ATAERSSFSDVSSPCCAPSRHCWLAQTGCLLCGFSSSMQRGELSGRQCSELADTYLEKVFAESQDHLAGQYSLARSVLPSFFGATTKKMRNDSSTTRKLRRPTLPNNEKRPIPLDSRPITQFPALSARIPSADGKCSQRSMWIASRFIAFSRELILFFCVGPF